MPELPDLQVFSINLTKALKGKKLVKVNVVHIKKLNVTKKELSDAIEGQELSEVIREGKQLHFVFKNKQVLGLHLMLHGQMFWFDEQNENKHTILELNFENGKGLAITDFQKQATPTLNPEKAEAPDALSKEADFKFWKDTLQKSKSNVKGILTNQHIIRGIGNAYADEILYDAKISPISIANKIPDDKVEVLARSVKKVLQYAEEKIMEQDPERISGELRDFLQVHRPKQKTTISGETIQQKVLSSRKTYYTSKQKLYD